MFQPRPGHCFFLTLLFLLFHRLHVFWVLQLRYRILNLFVLNCKLYFAVGRFSDRVSHEDIRVVLHNNLFIIVFVGDTEHLRSNASFVGHDLRLLHKFSAGFDHDDALDRGLFSVLN